MIEWLSTIHGYAEADGDTIPVLCPAREDDRLRWDNALKHIYTDKRDGPEERRRLVVACGPEPLPVARQLARRTNSALKMIDHPASLSDAVVNARQPNVLILAPSDTLRIGLVTRLIDVAAAAGKNLGFLGGRTVAGLSFSAAKILLSPQPGIEGVDELAALGHRLDHTPGSAEQVLASVGKPALAKIIHAHGEGSHAKLPGVTVCGLLDELEFPSAPHRGCSRPDRRCKRARHPNVQVLFGIEVPALCVVFACCNGFNFASELYPSPVALALAFAEGYAAAVITPIRPLIITDEIRSALRELLEAGTPIGEITNRLNRLSARIGQPTTFACHGDPCFALPTLAAIESRRSAKNGYSGVPEHLTEELSGCVEQVSEVPAVQQWLVRVLYSLDRARHLLRSIEIWLGSSGDDVTRFPATLLEKIQQLALYALKRAETVSRSDSVRALTRSTVPIRLLIGRWDDAVAQLLLSLRDKVDPFDIGHYDQLFLEMRRIDPCARCGTPLEASTYGAGLPPAEHRTAVLCSVCGPVREHRKKGVRVEAVEQVGWGSAGDELCIRFKLTVPRKPLVNQASVQLRFFDKARDRCIQESSSTVRAERQVLEFGFRLPDNLSDDLHTIRLMVSCGFDTAYARLRFASLPRTEVKEEAKENAVENDGAEPGRPVAGGETGT